MEAPVSVYMMAYRTEFINDECKAKMLHEWTVVDWHSWIQKVEHPSQLNAALTVLSGKRSKSLGQDGAKWRVVKEMIHERRRQIGKSEIDSACCSANV